MWVYLRTIAKDEELLALASRNLTKQRQQVVGNTLRVFTHDTTRMRAAGVEVSQKSAVPLLKWLALLLQPVALGVDVVGNDILNHRLGAAVGVCGANRAVLWDRNHVGESGGITVDGGGRGEDDTRDVVAGHGAHEANAAADVDAVVLERDLGRFANGL